jgi:hypothetical protein
MCETLEKAVKDIIMGHFSKIMEELEEIVNTDDVTLTIQIQHSDFNCEVCG